MPISQVARSKTWVLVCWDCRFKSRKSFSCECYVLSDRGLCVGMITRPEVKAVPLQTRVAQEVKVRRLRDNGTGWW